MTTSSPRDDPLQGGSRRGGGDDGADDPGELPADLEDLLVRVGKAVQRHGLYPVGHPALEPIVDDVLDGLDRALASRDRVSLGVGPDRLVHEEGESDPSHPLLSSLATRLHEHHVSRLTLRSGVGHDELSAFLGQAARSPETSQETLGMRRELTDEWPHVVVEPVRYEGLSMVEASVGEELAAADVDGEVGDLWLGLARSALAEEALDELDDDETPALGTMVSGLSDVTADRARARAVAGRMVALAQMLDRHGDEEEGDEAVARVQEQFLRLLERLGPGDLGKLLSAAPQQQRRAFVQATLDWLPAGTVVELLDELADSRDLDVSYQMLRLLSRLASYADLDADALDPEAGAAFREQIRRLVGGWHGRLRVGDGGEPGGGGAADGAGGPADDAAARGERPGAVSGPGIPVLPEGRSFVDPARVVRTALEVGKLGSLGREAIDSMAREGRTDELLEILRGAPDRGALEAAWELVDPPAAVHALLHRSPPDFGTVDELLEHRGADVAGPLLDLLSESESRSVRRRLFSRLAAMKGEDVTRAILDRVDDDRWFVQRNMLALLVEREGLPDGFAPLPYTRHSRSEVRKEAYKLAFRSPADRAEAVRRALGDTDRKALSLGLGALRTLPGEVVDEVVPRLRERLEADDLPIELARQAVRALGRSGKETALEALLEACRTRKMWRFWTVDLADKSPVVLEALEVLARRWSDRPEARRVLERAREADDPELRDAARAGSEAA